MAKLWGAEGRRLPARADCVLWALLAVFLLVEGLLLSTALLPSFDSVAQQEQELELDALRPVPIPLPLVVPDHQVERAPEGRSAWEKTEGGRDPTFDPRQPQIVGKSTQPPGTKFNPSLATAAPRRYEDGEDGEDQETVTPSAPLHVGRRWLLP